MLSAGKALASVKETSCQQQKQQNAHRMRRARRCLRMANSGSSGSCRQQTSSHSNRWPHTTCVLSRAHAQHAKQARKITYNAATKQPTAAAATVSPYASCQALLQDGELRVQRVVHAGCVLMHAAQPPSPTHLIKCQEHAPAYKVRQHAVSGVINYHTTSKKRPTHLMHRARRCLRMVNSGSRGSCTQNN
jgi:hypothetical protein